MKKKIERICKNCKLFDSENNFCGIVVLWEGERQHLPVDAEDACFFEEEYFDPVTKSTESFAEDIQEVKFWTEDEKGEKTDGNGVVKIEYPEGFFGNQTVKDILG